MKFRKLRIAWSVAWGVAAVLLCVLWVRSYFYAEGAGIALPQNCVAWIDSVRGRVLMSFRHETEITPSPSHGWSEPVYPDSLETIERNTGPQVLGFGVVHEPNYFRLRLPFWFLALSAAALATLPWHSWSWRFRLRTLLFATTLFAAGLGFVTYVLRK